MRICRSVLFAERTTTLVSDGVVGAICGKAGGVAAVVKRYGKDRTFSVPILTHCALAGIVDWKEVIPLPFELSCVPHRLYAAVKMPVVSYALPALIAIGQVIFKASGTLESRASVDSPQSHRAVTESSRVHSATERGLS